MKAAYWVAAAIAGAGFLYWLSRRSSPSAVVDGKTPDAKARSRGVKPTGPAGGGIVGGRLHTLLGLPDPETLSIGTVSADGQWVVRLGSMQPGATAQWEPTGAFPFGGLLT